MSGPTSPNKATAPYPDPCSLSSTPIPVTQSSPPLSSASSSASSSESEQTPISSSRPTSRRSRMDRPRLAERQRSSSSIIPKGNDIIQREKPYYPPDDARAMSPRRNSQDIEQLEMDVRQSLKHQARTLQSSLAALAEKIDEVKQDHDKLESENRFLQDYIGGLTRTMSKDNLGRSSSTRKGKKINFHDTHAFSSVKEGIVHCNGEGGSSTPRAHERGETDLYKDIHSHHEETAVHEKRFDCIIPTLAAL